VECAASLHSASHREVSYRMERGSVAQHDRGQSTLSLGCIFSGNLSPRWGCEAAGGCRGCSEVLVSRADDLGPSMHTPCVPPLEGRPFPTGERSYLGVTAVAAATAAAVSAAAADRPGGPLALSRGGVRLLARPALHARLAPEVGGPDLASREDEHTDTAWRSFPVGSAGRNSKALQNKKK